jgi:hypothetical protein
MKEIAILFFLLHISVVFSQESTNASGGNASGSNGNVSYSVGQITYSSYSGTGFVNEGIQFPFEITTLDTDDNSETNEILLFPNPASSGINLKINSLLSEEVKFVLCDSNGRILEESRITQNEIQISMVKYSKSIYFLKVIDKEKELKTFKIIKNH